MTTSSRVRNRVAGWIKSRFTRQPAANWIVFDGHEFSEYTGVSIRSVRYAVRELRDHPESEFTFRTVFDHDAGEKGAWKLLVALEERLRNSEPMDTDRQGRRRHVRDELRGSECKPNIREGSYATQHTLSPEGEKRLRLKAKCIARRLEFVHWDNCKVDHEFNVALGYVFGCLKDGWSEDQIATAYRIGVQRMHGTATDLGVRFGPGSAINRARRYLDASGGTPEGRMRDFYLERRKIGELVRESIATASRGLTDPNLIVDTAGERPQIRQRNVAGDTRKGLQEHEKNS